MKTSRIFGSLILALFPVLLYAQRIELPSVEIQYRQDKVPAVVKDAALRDFGPDHKPMAWITPQSVYNTTRWEQTENVDNMDIYSYALHTGTTNGDRLDAIYSPEGKRISSREFMKNFRTPENILMTLYKGEYKDWSVKNNFHVIKSLSNGSEKERYKFVLVKGKEKKNLYFDNEGNIVGKRSYLLALAD